MGGGYFQVGIVTGPVGLKGEVKVYPTTDDPERFGLLREVLANGVSYEIENTRRYKNLVVLKLAGVNTVEEAEGMRGKPLMIPPELALPLSDDEYYHRDLIDMRVFSEDGRELGLLVRILETGANDVYVVHGENGEILVPAVSLFIASVDVPGKRMVIRLLPGMEP